MSYISREDALNFETLTIECDLEELGSIMRGMAIYADYIKGLQTEDVASVLHGRWIKLDMHKGMEQYMCSLCRSDCYVPECMGEPLYSFCPCCGAKMDGGDGDV